MQLYEQDNKHPAAWAARNATVLVVDDFTSMCELIARQLNSLGYRALTASNGKEAKEVILMHGSANIDLLITEMELPFMRGEELIQWFLQEEPRAQVIMMSSYPHAVNLREGITFLKKPFCLDTLKAKIGESLAKAEFNHKRPVLSNL